MTDREDRKRVRLPLLPAWLRWLAVAGLAGFVFYTSVVTTPPETALDAGAEFAPLDKWRHFLAYAAIGSALSYALVDSDRGPEWAVLVAFGLAVAYGIGIELVQTPLPARTGSPADAVANVLGCLVVVPWYLLVRVASFVPITRWGQSVPDSDTRSG